LARPIVGEEKRILVRCEVAEKQGTDPGVKKRSTDVKTIAGGPIRWGGQEKRNLQLRLTSFAGTREDRSVGRVEGKTEAKKEVHRHTGFKRTGATLFISEGRGWFEHGAGQNSGFRTTGKDHPTIPACRIYQDNVWKAESDSQRAGREWDFGPAAEDTKEEPRS